jgi:hypothetical protein
VRPWADEELLDLGCHRVEVTGEGQVVGAVELDQVRVGNHRGDAAGVGDGPQLVVAASEHEGRYPHSGEHVG